MVHDKYHKIALIDADYYIINYSSTITTYIQHICNNLLNNNRNDVNLKDDTNEQHKINNKYDDILYKKKQIICIFMLQIFLNNLDKNLNLFDYLIIVINKYFHLVQKYKLTNTYGNIKIEDNTGICKNKKDTKTDVSILGEGRQSHTEISLSDYPNKEIAINNNINNKSSTPPTTKEAKKTTSITTNTTNTTNTSNNNNNNNNKNEEKIDCINISNPNNLSKDNIIITQDDQYKHLIHNLIENNNYINIDNIIKSHLCFVNIKGNEHDKSSKKKSSSCLQINNIIYEKKLCNNINYSETDIDNNLIMSDENDFIDSTNKDIKKKFPDMINNKKLLIDYNKINIKLKHFDDTININDLIKGYKVYEDVGSIYEIKNLFRILILSKLHIGVYNLLYFLKKKNIFMLFYSSNKNLTNLLFKYNKIYKYYQNYYNVIDSLDELKKYEKDCHKFLIFSNRSCFICHAKRHGIFYTAIGNKKNDDNNKNENNNDSNNIEKKNNYYNRKTSNCDDIDWTNEIYEQIKSDECIENFSNEYNNVVYPFIKNCNLTLDILSWRMIYIFKKYLYIYGKVVKGFGRGSKYLNLPTANIFHPNFISADIMPGIYFGICKLRDKIFKSVISIGYNPYFKNKHMTIEAFLYYKTDDLFYDENIHLIIIGIIRSESNFAYFSHLIQAIQFDCELARIVLNKLKNNETFQQCRYFLDNIK
ncbi:riboflavin kinase / FAD synthase family protein, putative [Plasmodium reichenowi]|uniref:riboflavin kinase n=1 Tax=Plasmodium reichenowi TaxID=5854 RepID=A0A060S3S0_PLARE|nr:riboflavin kinase / FAD synthase family protein, putative [Plasmodium reichenowi]